MYRLTEVRRHGKDMNCVILILPKFIDDDRFFLMYVVDEGDFKVGKIFFYFDEYTFCLKDMNTGVVEEVDTYKLFELARRGQIFAYNVSSGDSLLYNVNDSVYSLLNVLKFKNGDEVNLINALLGFSSFGLAYFDILDVKGIRISKDRIEVYHSMNLRQDTVSFKILCDFDEFKRILLKVAMFNSYSLSDIIWE